MASVKAFSPKGEQPLLGRGTMEDSFQNNMSNTSRQAWPVGKEDPRPPSRSFSSFSSRASKNPFFSRNNPHSQRVRHLKGLLDLPVCTVIDSQEMEDNSERLMVCTPTLDQIRQKPLRGLRMPINDNSFVYVKERAVPGVGLVPITFRWREELSKLVDAAGLNSFKKNPYTVTKAYQLPPGSRQGLQPEERPSSQINDIIPPPSRAGSRMLPSRQGSRCREEPPPSRNGLLTPLSRGGDKPLELQQGPLSSRQPLAPLREEQQLQHIMEFPDNEGYMMNLLGDILQTDSPVAIQSWLINASVREKDIMANMIRAVVSSQDEPTKAGNPSNSPVYGDQLLQAETSVDVGNIQQYNTAKKDEEQRPRTEAKEENKPKSSQAAMAQQYQWTSPGCKPSSPFIAKQNNAANSLFLDRHSPRTGTAEAEIEEIRSRLQSRASPRVFGHQSRTAAARPVSRPHTQQSLYVPPAEALTQNAQRPPSHQSIKNQQSVIQSILLYKPDQDQ